MLFHIIIIISVFVTLYDDAGICIAKVWATSHSLGTVKWEISCQTLAWGLVQYWFYFRSISVLGALSDRGVCSAVVLNHANSGHGELLNTSFFCAPTWPLALLITSFISCQMLAIGPCSLPVLSYTKPTCTPLILHQCLVLFNILARCYLDFLTFILK